MSSNPKKRKEKKKSVLIIMVKPNNITVKDTLYIVNYTWPT